MSGLRPLAVGKPNHVLRYFIRISIYVCICWHGLECGYLGEGAYRLIVDGIACPAPLEDDHLRRRIAIVV